MEIVKSKFKLKGGLTIFILLSGFAVFLASNVLYGTDDSLNELNVGTFMIYFWITFICLFVIIGIFKESRILFLSETKIEIKYPFLLFFKNTWFWNHIDGYYTILESTQYKSYETIYIVRNGRVWLRVSSFTYKNYNEILEALPIKNLGRLDKNSFIITYYMLGGKIKP